MQQGRRLSFGVGIGRIAPAHIGLLREAGWAETAVDLTYLDRSGGITERRIWPRAIVWLDRALMCLAWYTLRQDYRRFHLDRMSGDRLTDSSFRPRRVSLLRDYIVRLKSRPAPDFRPGRVRTAK